MNDSRFAVEERPSVIVSGTCHFQKKVKKVGRPRKKVNWPDGQFTFEDILEVNGNLSKSSIRNKVIERLKVRSLRKSGKIKTSFGRPRDLYQELNQEL